MTGYTNNEPIFEGQYSHTYDTLAGILGDADTKIIKESRAQMYLARSYGGYAIQVVLDKTPIVVHWNGSFLIDNGGWYGLLSKKRITEFIPEGWYLYQDKFFWYLQGHGNVFPYKHQMLVTYDGDGATGVREQPHHIHVNGKWIPAFTVAEYMDRAVTAVVHWVMNHAYFDEDGRPYRNDGHHLAGEIVGKCEEALDAVEDIRGSRDGTDMLAATLKLSNLLHANGGGWGKVWGDSGVILEDYGRKYGLTRHLIQYVSEGADRYFGQDQLDRFMARPEEHLPRVPVYSLP